MTASRLNRARSALIDLVVGSLGFVSWCVLRSAQKYSNQRQFSRCSKIGVGVTAGDGLEIYNAGFVAIGDHVAIAKHALLNCYRGGSIRIGAHCFLGDNVKIVSERANISLGEDCLIAENVSIRASNHGTRAETLIRLQENTVADISIGKDVWIGSAVTVLAGSVIADGCVIGANSVVRGATEAYAIYVGCPIRKVGSRSQQASVGTQASADE